MRTIDQTIHRVRSFAKDNGLSKSRFAVDADLGINALRDFESSDWNPTVDTLRKLEAIIPGDYSPEEINTA